MTVRASRVRLICVGLLGLGFGLAFLVSLWIKGEPWKGVLVLLWMLAVTGALLFVALRSEFVGVLLSGKDERFKGIDVHATAAAGVITWLVIQGMFFYELARGHVSMPYLALIAVFTVSYIAALTWKLWRR